MWFDSKWQFFGYPRFVKSIRSHIAKYGNKVSSLSSCVSHFTLTPYELKFTSGRASYLSDTICDEFIDLIGEKVLNTILAQIREAKYFSITVDSTPDVTHYD